MEENKKNEKEIEIKKEESSEEKKRDILKWGVIALSGFVVILLSVGLGIWIGGERARFSYRWADNYHKNFGGPKEGFFMEMRRFPQDNFMSGHGEFGTIIKINGSEIMIKGRDNMEKFILAEKDTVVKNAKNDIKLSDLKIDDFIVIIGSPNDSGQIEAKIIRVLPLPPDESSNVPMPLRKLNKGFN